MRPEISPEELRQLPGYEIRANVFMDRVQEVERKMAKTRPSTMLMVTMEDADQADKELSDAERGRIEDFYKELGEVWIPPESRGEMVVRVYASCDFWKPLKKFVKKTLDLAREQGGRLDGNTKPLSNKEIEAMIARDDVDSGETWFIFNRFFTFDENLPGLI